jgi:TPR repeat protein
VLSHGTEKNIEKALYWYKRASDKGHSDAIANYSNLVIQEKMENKYKTSFKLLRKCMSKHSELCMWSTAKFFTILEPEIVLKEVNFYVECTFNQFRWM